MKKQILAVLFLLVAGFQLVNAEEDFLASIAQVRVTAYSFDIENPWQRGSAGQYLGSAVLIENGRLITNAHVVTHPLRVEVKRGDSNRWYKASIEYVSDASDLATLVVPDKAFYKAGNQVVMGGDIAIGSQVSVVGFPVGGDSASITQGILSRTEVTGYAHSGMENLTYQLDAAINSGNSGGAVFHNGRLVGISTQTMDDADNIGYAIPVPVIKQFLADIKDGVVDGVPTLPYYYQNVLNANQRAFYGLGDKNGLRLVEAAGPTADRCLAVDDIIVSVEGLVIGSDGLVNLGDTGFVPVDYLAAGKQIGDFLDFQIVRKDKLLSVNCKLEWNWAQLWAVPPVTYDYRPGWSQVGGIVLVEMTDEVFEYLHSNEIDVAGAVLDFQADLQQGKKDAPVKHLLAVNILQHDANEGYEVVGLMLKSLNGVDVRNIDHLEALIEANESPWLTLEFDDRSTAVFASKSLGAINNELKSEYGF